MIKLWDDSCDINQNIIEVTPTQTSTHYIPGLCSALQLIFNC